MAVTACSCQTKLAPMLCRPHRARFPVPLPAGISAPSRQGRQSHRGARTVVSAVFGVGAPEAALVGVVALVVFGPQGLIDAAKAAAAAIRSFQPAIQEISQASTEIRSTITNEMGIEALQKEFQEVSRTTRDSLSLNPSLTTSSMQSPVSGTSTGGSTSSNTHTGADGNGHSEVGERKPEESVIATMPKSLDSSESKSPSATSTQSIEEDSDFVLERKRAESAALAWAGTDPVSRAQHTPLASVPKRLEDMTMAELEQELERRKKMIQAIDNLNV